MPPFNGSDYYTVREWSACHKILMVDSRKDDNAWPLFREEHVTRRTDLEQHLRASYKLINEYEDILSLSADPAERAWARRAIDEQWDINP